ncbi:uncharacterized protein VP01_7224g1 [Puccinia sorghi]|uniref:Uncharacterized protein n=1 Tax=Puccinia sorghi TaxID=27349 RepID=A0A0L6UE25_9BASI|nr:uncharacterized protein VP01_7224g1 [Puccinia sorghi]
MPPSCFKVTEILCRSNYPTLIFVIPIYMSLIKNIIKVKSTYNSSQLIMPAKKMVEKLRKYLFVALEKPPLLCAMILDPKIKL